MALQKFDLFFKWLLGTRRDSLTVNFPFLYDLDKLKELFALHSIPLIQYLIPRMVIVWHEIGDLLFVL